MQTGILSHFFSLSLRKDFNSILSQELKDLLTSSIPINQSSKYVVERIQQLRNPFCMDHHAWYHNLFGPGVPQNILSDLNISDRLLQILAILIPLFCCETFILISVFQFRNLQCLSSTLFIYLFYYPSYAISGPG